MTQQALIEQALREEFIRRQREEAVRFFNQIPGKRHRKQAEALFSPKRILGVFGGNRTGKTVVGALRTVLFMLGRRLEPYIQDWSDEDKEKWYKMYYPIKGDMEGWCGTINWDVHRDITQPELMKWIPQPILNDPRTKIYYRRKEIIDYIRFPNNSRLTFKSYDSGVDAFQGKSLNYLWLDEECDQQIWQECQMRLLDKKGYATITMTPLKGLTWAYKEIYVNDLNDPEIESYQFTWDDNPWLDDEEKNRMMARLSEDELAARKFGEFMAVGSGVLSNSILMKRKREISEPAFRMSWNGYKFTKDPDGELEVYEPPKPGRFYILGADVAEGLPSGDNSVGCVIDSQTAEQVAELTVKADPEVFARMLDQLGKWYNTALIAPERNNNGHAVLLGLDSMLAYPAIYRHPDDGRLGWPQNSKTRPIIVSHMQEAVKEMPETINSKGLIDEGLTFVRNDRGRPEASGKGKKGGHKDDRLFAWAIGLAVREMYGPPLDPVKPKREKKQTVPRRPDKFFEDFDEDVEGQNYARFDWNSYVDFD